MGQHSEIYLAGGCFWGMEKYLASIRESSQRKSVTQTETS